MHNQFFNWINQQIWYNLKTKFCFFNSFLPKSSEINHWTPRLKTIQCYFHMQKLVSRLLLQSLIKHKLCCTCLYVALFYQQINRCIIYTRILDTLLVSNLLNFKFNLYHPNHANWMPNSCANLCKSWLIFRSSVWCANRPWST